MKTKHILALALLVSPAFLAFTLPADKVAFAPKEGSSVSKTFTTKAEFSLDSMSMTMNGQPSPAMPETHGTLNLRPGSKLTFWSSGTRFFLFGNLASSNGAQ